MAVKMRDGYFFVYALSHEDCIFYIGCTKNIKRRYLTHLNPKNIGPMAQFIQSILSKGEIPTLKVITYCPRLEAHSVEEVLIKCLNIGGHKLYNTQHCKPRKIDKWNNKKEAIKNLINTQNTFFSSRWGYYKPYIKNIDKLKQDENTKESFS